MIMKNMIFAALSCCACVFAQEGNDESNNEPVVTAEVVVDSSSDTDTEN